MGLPLADSSQRTRLRLLAAVLLLSFATYANTLFNGFVYDDAQVVLENPYIQSFAHVGRIFRTTVFSFQGEDGTSNYYRPLLNIAYLLCHSIFGDLPFGYHLVDVLLNGVVVALVFGVAVQLFRDPTQAFLAAAIFALHPAHTEAVAWIACIADLELGVFYLLSFLCFLRLEDAAGRRAALLYFAMLVSFLLALLSKEPAITLPVMATLYEHFFRRDRNRVPLNSKIARYVGLWLVAAAYLVFRVYAMGAAVPLLKHPDVTWPQAALTALALVAQYAGKLFWPWPLSVAYPFHKSVALGEPHVLAGMLVVFACGALFAFLWKRARAQAFAVLWIFVTLAPALNARWMATYVFAERNLYLTSAGFSWLGAAGILWLWRRGEAGQPAAGGRRVVLAVACAVLALLATGAILARNRDFKDDGTLLSRTLALHPDAALIRSNLGGWHWSRGQAEEGERQWWIALHYDPQNAFALANLGMAMLEQKRYAEATGYLKRAIAIRPNFSAPHLHLGRMYAAQGLGPDAEKEFRRAIEINPFSTSARNSLARFCLESGRLDEAAAQFRASVESIPNEDAWAGLAEVFSRQNSTAQAEQAWKEVTRLNPFHARAHFALGKIYLASRRFAEAEKEFQAGLLVDPSNAEALEEVRKLSSPQPN
jgi:tetratricopeptide (TPR) repeat protein